MKNGFGHGSFLGGSDEFWFGPYVGLPGAFGGCVCPESGVESESPVGRCQSHLGIDS
jgi:hypothetical protein